MIKLKKSEKVGRMLRQDDAPDLAIPTWTLLREAIIAGKTEEALKWADYANCEAKSSQDGVIAYVEDIISHLAGLGDEEEVYKALRKRYLPKIKKWLTYNLTAEEALQLAVDAQRGHGGSLVITEEPERYKVVCDPCGSGGHMRRTKNVGTTRKPYPWTWGKSGVPYYCAHCCVYWEILPTELRGYPARINLIGDKPEDPCVRYYYKNPEQIPEEYFTRIGMKKDVTKFKR